MWDYDATCKTKYELFLKGSLTSARKVERICPSCVFWWDKDVALYWKYRPPRPGPEWECAYETMPLCLISMCSKTTWNYWRRHWKNVLCILPHDLAKHNVVSERPLIHIWTAANESGVSCGMKIRRWKTNWENSGGANVCFTTCNDPLLS